MEALYHKQILQKKFQTITNFYFLCSMATQKSLCTYNTPRTGKSQKILSQQILLLFKVILL